MKKPGAVSAETKARIIESAINEFNEYGYQNSSLRTICANAGVTTGALYFFFRNKEDLFTKIIDSVLSPLEITLKDYYIEKKQKLDYSNLKNEESDYKLADYVLTLYYEHKREWNIFLNNLVFPSIKKRIHQAIEDATDHYVYVLDTAYEKGVCKHKVDRFSVHQFAHIQASVILTVFYHDFDDDQIKTHIHTAIKMLRGSFFALLED